MNVFVTTTVVAGVVAALLIGMLIGGDTRQADIMRSCKVHGVYIDKEMAMACRIVNNPNT